MFEIKHNEFKQKIIKNKNKIWNPEFNPEYFSIDTNSCFDINIHPSDYSNVCNFKDIKVADKDIKKCFKVRLYPSHNQKLILDDWFNAYIDMYNATQSFVKKRFFNDKNTILDYKKLRTSYLKDVRDKIIHNSQSPFYVTEKGKVEKDTKVKTHMIDSAIRLLCANYKSAISNKKRFKMNYWKKNKSIKIIDIEPNYFRQNTICDKVFGKIKYEEVYVNGKKFKLDDIREIHKCECKLQYYKETGEYILFVPRVVTPKEKSGKQKVVSLDPGIRTFMTGISDNAVLQIGNNISNVIKEKLKILDKIKNNEKISSKIKKKNEKNINKKISNLVDEMHWKTIRYLTENHSNILVGDLSVTGITSRKTSKLNKMTKRIAYKLKFFTFRQRLEFKCKENKVGYKMVDEWCTSKTCSMCGTINHDLGASKKFKCDKCKTTQDRDVNASRCIFIKGL